MYVVCTQKPFFKVRKTKPLGDAKDNNISFKIGVIPFHTQ